MAYFLYAVYAVFCLSERVNELWTFYNQAYVERT